MIDQFLLYDQAMITWLTNTFPPLIVGRNTQILIAIGRKGFVEVTSGTLVDNNTLTLPRISVQRLDPENHPERFNSNRIRRLGFCGNGEVIKMRSGKFPSPVNFNYQIDLWTRYASEMNLWMQKILFDFDQQYIYLSIRPDDIWGDKKYIVFLDGAITDNSELEPGEGERQIRRTFNLRAEARLYDQSTIPVNVLKRIEMRWLDYDDSTLYERQYLPPLEIFGTGTGGQTVFTALLDRPPVVIHTPVIQTIIGGSTVIVHDDGSGNWIGDSVAGGSINYTTGSISITFNSPPDSGEDLTITYFTDV